MNGRPGLAERQARAHRQRQRGLIWAGPLGLVMWVAAFVFLAGFIPPPHAHDTARQIFHIYASKTFRIRLGMIIALFGSALIVPFAAAISAQMRRIEGPNAPLAMTQICSAALLSLEFIVPIVVWQAAAYRFNVEGLKITQTLNDLGWLLFVSVVSSLLIQTISIAWAILTDVRDTPVFPRWVGFLNLWVTVLLAPAGIVPLFKSGAFSWAGLMSFFVPLTAYCVWTIVMFVMLRRAIAQEESESEAGAESPTGGDVADNLISVR
jgi:Ca2+/Na+ antiporter